MSRYTMYSLAIALGFCLCVSVTTAQSDPPLVDQTAETVAMLTIGEAVTRNVDGWRETGRTNGIQADGRIASLGAPAVLGDRLVSVGQLCEPDGGTCEAVGWHSSDGIEWSAAPLPGDVPTVDATAAAPGRMVAIGRIGADGTENAVWSTSDGLDWALAPAAPPPFAREVAATDEAIVLRAMKRLWTSADGSAWTEIRGPQNVLGVESGPGGFIAWTGGRVSKDVFAPAQAWRSIDGADWTTLELPGRLADLEPFRAALHFLPLEDEWVLAPPDRTLKRSLDGQAWEQAPGGSQRFEHPMDWVIRIEARYHAFGQFHPARGMWSWRWDQWDRPDNLWTDEVMHRPLEWQGELIGFGEIAPKKSDPVQVAWRWEGTPPIPSLEATGLEVLSRHGLKTDWGQHGDVIATDDGLVALGSWGDWRGPRGVAWSSPDGRSWKRTHRLPWGTHLVTAVPRGDGSLLAFGERWYPMGGGHRGTWTWRLDPDGSIGPARRLPGQATCCQGPIDVAGAPGTGMVVLLGEELEVIVKRPGRRWAEARLPGVEDHRSVGVVETQSGVVVVASSPEGIAAWRSTDGVVWQGPEVLPRSEMDHVRNDMIEAQDVIYEEERDILLVVAYPDRVWRSEAGGPFESTGPLAIALTDPAANDGVHRGVALADGFLVATSDGYLDVLRTRLQMSVDGETWTPAPPMRTAIGYYDLLEHDDRLLFLGGSFDVTAAPASIAEYPTWPVDVTP